MDVSARERDKRPVFSVEDVSRWLDQDFGHGDLRFEDQIPLDPEKTLEIAGLGDVAVGRGDLGSVAGQLLVQTSADLGGGVGEELRDSWVRDKVGELGVILLGVVFNSVVHLILQVFADGGEVDLGLDAVLGKNTVSL